MQDLVRLINHPGVPWSGGGVAGGIVGFLAGQPQCGTFVDGRFVPGCVEARLPLLDAPADLATFTAIFTVAGALIGYVAGKLNR